MQRCYRGQKRTLGDEEKLHAIAGHHNSKKKNVHTPNNWAQQWEFGSLSIVMTVSIAPCSFTKLRFQKSQNNHSENVGDFIACSFVKGQAGRVVLETSMHICSLFGCYGF